MINILAVSHLVSASVALFLAGTLISLRKGGQARHKRPHRLTARRLTITARRTLSGLLWAVLAAAGRPLANRRYGLVEPVLRPAEEHLAARRHRLGHALCLPALTRMRWLLRCRGCRAWVQLREVPALDGTGVDLQVVGGSLHDAGPCPARYLDADAAASAGAPTAP